MSKELHLDVNKECALSANGSGGAGCPTFGLPSCAGNDPEIKQSFNMFQILL